MNRSYRGGLFVAAAINLALVASCSAFDYGDVPAVEVSVNASNPTWENGIQALVEAKCDNCHGAAESKFDPGEIRDRPALRFAISDSEADFAPYGERTYVRVFQSDANPMPPTYGTPLTVTEKRALRAYLDAEGFNPDAKTEVDRAAFLAEKCATVDESANADLTFAGDLAVPVNSCTGCHTGSAPAGGGIDLSTAALWKQYREDVVFVLFTDDVSKQMPKGRAANFLEAGQNGRILANYACASSEVLP